MILCIHARAVDLPDTLKVEQLMVTIAVQIGMHVIYQYLLSAVYHNMKVVSATAQVCKRNLLRTFITCIAAKMHVCAIEV